ncbi:MAG: ABC transporter ATP-binding protein [Lachnospiraceae bacterium]|nr:ABC transporter ATP-binding protein [Lachnospiraceae bacterium]
MAIIELRNVGKTYGKGECETEALKNVNIKIDEGDFWSIMGPSGSGKSTLLNILGCMDKPSEGEYLFNGKSIEKYSVDELSYVRNTHISFVFQHFALLNDYSVFDNIILPLNCKKMTSSDKKNKAEYYMKQLGIESLGKKKPSQISGGQQQRVAIARALITEPDVILADEPTGALDQKTGEELMKLLKEINIQGKTIIVVTHDEKIANVASKRIYIEDGICHI